MAMNPTSVRLRFGEVKKTGERYWLELRFAPRSVPWSRRKKTASNYVLKKVKRDDPQYNVLMKEQEAKYINPASEEARDTGFYGRCWIELDAPGSAGALEKRENYEKKLAHLRVKFPNAATAPYFFWERFLEVLKVDEKDWERLYTVCNGNWEKIVDYLKMQYNGGKEHPLTGFSECLVCSIKVSDAKNTRRYLKTFRVVGGTLEDSWEHWFDEEIETRLKRNQRFGKKLKKLDFSKIVIEDSEVAPTLTEEEYNLQQAMLEMAEGE